ncbi:hypothetical protein IQ274_35985 [Nostoc sp. LEGE 12447]|uniref:hypothetical protein n=1 Tax=Nostoc sp. LEGE 12447 TaxID=1828640 RepID=UPI0018832E70|nr:hypothetical protein [Nostoc sp. LEGE 12447]MBE9003409.1 hypothetical protein [Nostoc sp. LEGE 12447]
MSRIKRWINMHKKEFNADGTLKGEVRQQKLSLGAHPEAVDDYARRVKARYDEWKHLDETDPEPWPIYTAYDFFSEQEKREFNPDGSLRPEYVEYARKIGISESALEQLEWRKKIEVDNYNKVSAKHAEQGINFGEERMKERIEDSRTYAQRRRQMEQDLRNFEPEESLPFDKNTSY